jgi:hypothetical protein
MNYIFEQVHHIDRHELQIDSVSLCTKLGIAITVTRNCIGIWKVDQIKFKVCSYDFVYCNWNANRTGNCTGVSTCFGTVYGLII